MIVEKLRQFGLDEKQISVYLSLISLGPSPVRVISAKSGVNRGTTYDILKALIKDGLVSYYQQYGRESKKQYFVAEPPEKIVSAIEKRMTDLSTLKESVKARLPELDALYEKSGAKPVSKYYEGSLGLRIILQDVIATMTKSKEKKYFVYSSADIRDYLYKAYPNFNRERLKAKIEVSAIAIGKGGETVGLDQRKWMSKEHSSPTYILIYDGKVAMISVDNNNNPLGVMIEDNNIYQTQRIVFEFIWDKL